MVERRVENQTGSLTPDHKKSRIDPTTVCANGVRHTFGKILMPDVFKINAKIEECRTVAAGGRAIPVVDLSGLHGEKRAELVEQMRAASEEWGFFQIVNHSVPGEYMDEILKVHTEFFEMPMEEKMKYYSDDVRAPFKYGVGQVATSYQEQAWKDHLTLLYQENMDTSNWPKVPARFIEITEAYNHAVNKLKSELMQALSEGLGLQSNELDDVFGPVQRTYTNFYPKCPEADRVFGARPHSDPNSITILLQDDVGGLEVRDLKYREWVQVKTIPHAFVINMGDQMEVFTNGKYRSISHRVRVNPDKNRISIASFISPKPRTVVEPSPLLVGEEGPLNYLCWVPFLVNYNKDVDTVPDVFKINAKIEECRTVAAGGRAIPVVDLSGLHGEKRAELVEQMRAASEEWGFFQIVNHSVPGEYMDEILKVHTEFFEMPMEEKMKYYSDDVRAPFKYGVGQVATSYQEQAWKDHLTLLYQEKMDTSNWPKVPARFIEITEAYNHAVNKLKSELMQALSEGLGLQSNELDDVFGPVQRTYTNFYPKCPEADRVFGARPHSDPNSITILLQDDVGGLEVRDLKYREWVQVKTIPHAFVINMGDQMEVFTNGKYRSISHRVRVNPDKNRISIASFISPKPRTVVEPSPLLVGEEGPLYKGDNFRDYLLGFYGNDINEKLYIESIKLKQGGQLQLK
ncbi:unnamed protein product [Sphagnum jensenii]|uniref:Fe2OG dioxygenase domain-containing protein n=1 Tax=Sphagnum jensenii TaxID=128206 RepID=A0ABP0XDM4_9BRYO